MKNLDPLAEVLFGSETDRSGSNPPMRRNAGETLASDR
jgi:hypothetical protein